MSVETYKMNNSIYPCHMEQDRTGLVARAILWTIREINSPEFNKEYAILDLKYALNIIGVTEEQVKETLLEVLP